MDSIYIAAAVPFFFLLMGLEYAYARRTGRSDYYSFEDAVASLGCGITQQVTALFLVGFIVGAYILVFEATYPLGTALPLWAQWLGALLGVDFMYYWFHRASHRVNILWATHVVHHQSEQYNLSTALRQGALQGAATAPFYWPLALAGVSPAVFLGAVTINTLYQFWIHTRLVPKLPWGLELWLNTPSHHRVHHGIDPEYIDKNYAGMFIVWDKLFGTFLEEKAEPNYGTVKPLQSWNPLWANVSYFIELYHQQKEFTSLKDKLYLWFAPPEWRPAVLGGPVHVPIVHRASRALYGAAGTATVRVVVALQFIVVTIATVSFLLWQDSMPALRLAPLSFGIVLTICSWAGAFEKRTWSYGAMAIGLGCIAFGVYTL